ncbi:MAG: HPr family phosphocarrier protein [Candidatus Onthomonas sp.]
MRKQLWANLNSIDKAKDFASLASLMPCEIDVCSGRYVVDAKSILGLFSIDLSVPVEIVIHGTPEEVEEFTQKCQKFLVAEEA